MSQSAFSPPDDIHRYGFQSGGFDIAMMRDSSDDDDHWFRPLGSSGQLTVSFAPDGTKMLDGTSRLYESFAGMLGAAALERTILDALNTWAMHGNVNIGRVADDGSPFGSAGLTYGDPRFGDIRIGSATLASDTLAIGLSQDNFVSGTWAGDILFNSDAAFTSKSQLFAVALHEAGHALGLPHSNDPNSVMHPASTRTTLSQGDIEQFQQLYGVRDLDAYDRELPNNLARNSTNLEFKDEVGHKGDYPVVAFGDVSAIRDYDFYRVEFPDEFEGPVSFAVLAQGISLLAPALTVVSEDGSILADVRASQFGGDDVSVTLDRELLGDKVYVRVRGTGRGAIGTYGLSISENARQVPDASEVEAAIKNRMLRFVDQEVVARYLEDPDDFYINDDGHTDDDDGSSSPLGSDAGYPLNGSYHYVASLADAADVDVYSVTTPNFDSSQPTFMNLSLRSTVVGGMAPRLELYDSNGILVPANVVVNGLGEYALQVPAVAPETSYHVHVLSDDLLPFTAGNYDLSVAFSNHLVDYKKLADGMVGPFVGRRFSNQGKSYQSLHVAESQMFQFEFLAPELAGGSRALLWATIYDENDQVVYRMATRTGETRTAETAYFAPGSYTIEVQVASYTAGNGGFAAISAVPYEFWGIDVGGGQGPAFSDPTNSPFDKNKNGDYVYPDDVITNASFVFVDGISSNQHEPPPQPPPADLFSWYWGLLP